MKLTKKLFPAIGMLLLSACMLVTSTFAWFSMNETVYANNMTVTAKGDQVYLQIINESATNFTAGAAETMADAVTTNKALLPTNVVKAINNPATDCTAYDGSKDIVWVTNIGTDNDTGTAKTTYTEVTSDAATNNGKYYLKNTFYIRLDPTAGAEQAGAPLKVSNIAITETATNDAFLQCFSVLVVCTIGEGESATVMGDLWNYQSGAFKHDATTSATLSTGNFAVKDKSAKVDIYVFFNGDNEACTLANLALAAEASYEVDVTFSVA